MGPHDTYLITCIDGRHAISHHSLLHKVAAEHTKQNSKIIKTV